MKYPRLMLAAPASGSGKTLITCGILQALVNRKYKTASFKCGPDYIDPMFHERIIGTKSRNLDTFFTGKETTRCLFCRTAEGQDISVAEGVMGYYDGLGGISVEGSSCDVAETLEMPVVLILNTRGQSMSVLPVIKGFLEYRQPTRIRGVIFNRMSPMIYQEMKEITERELSVKVLGYVPPVPELVLESRHLGLVLPGEIPALKEKLQALASVLEETLDLNALIRMAEEAGELSAAEPEEVIKARQLMLKKEAAKPLRIAVAKDEAFCFTYEDNLQLLRELGAELAEFSPMRDEKLPEGCCGMILSGGYPELYAEELSKNRKMKEAVRRAEEEGMPCLAECGGFLYLHEELEGKDGSMYPMAGVIPARAYKTDKLGRFGYITLTAKEDQLLLEKGGQIRGHEFHYWESEDCGSSMHAQKPLRKRNWDCVHGSGSLYAGFPHLFFYSNPQAAVNFLKACRAFAGKA